MRFAFPITKTEKLEDGRLLIEGTATSEALDSQGDIMDYEGSKNAFGKWRGNLREAHDSKKPVGKALEVIPNDETKTIDVRAFVSAGALDTQAKVMDGTLAMFSVGGDSPRKTKTEKVGGKAARRVMEWDMIELSLVDVGANPDAGFTLAKGAEASDAISEAAEPVEACEKADTPPPFACKEPGHKDMTPAEHEKAHEEKPEEKAAEPAEKAAEPEIKKDATAVYDARTALDGISAGMMAFSITESLVQTETAEKEAGHKEPPKQLAALQQAMASYKAGNDALAVFIQSELGEVGEPTVPSVANSPMLALARTLTATALAKSATAPAPQEIDLDALAAKVAALLPIQKSAPASEPDARIDAVLSDVSSLSKTVGEVKADTGDLKAIRDEVKKTAEGIEKMLALPAPGRAPMRMQPAFEKASTATPSNEANILRRIANGAPPSARDFLLNEANAIERG